jgi:hypothetical protein
LKESETGKRAEAETANTEQEKLALLSAGINPLLARRRFGGIFERSHHIPNAAPHF